MSLRLRPVFLVVALLLTGAALGFRAQAVECEEEDHEWVNLGDCCFFPTVGKLHLRECVNGQWVLRSTYKCPPTEPCG
jgi:hypothetical protein